MGGGPCVRLVLPWSGSSPAIEAAGRQNKAGGGAHTERQRQPRLLRFRRQCTSRLSLCASSCPCLLKHWIATRKTIASHQPHFYQERSNGLCQTSQSNMAATDLALLSRAMLIAPSACSALPVEATRSCEAATGSRAISSSRSEEPGCSEGCVAAAAVAPQLRYESSTLILIRS